MKPNYFTVSLFILACTAFMSANTIEDNYQCPENKMQKDVENITIETIKGKWIWKSIEGVEVEDVDFYLSFTENNLILSGSRRNSITSVSKTLFSSLFYLSDTIDDTFDTEKMSNKRGKYIIMSNSEDVANGKTICIMLEKGGSNENERTFVFKSLFYDNPAKIIMKVDTSKTNAKMPILTGSHIHPYNNLNASCVNNNNLLGEWRVDESMVTIVTFSINGCISLLQKNTSNGITTEEIYRSFYYLSDLPDSHFDLSKLTNAKGKYIVVKNPFYDNQDQDDTIIFFIKTSDENSIIILCSHKEGRDFILRR